MARFANNTVRGFHIQDGNPVGEADDLLGEGKAGS
jgi:hypothetical protein